MVAQFESDERGWLWSCQRLQAHKNLKEKKQARCRRTIQVSESLTEKLIIDPLKNTNPKKKHQKNVFFVKDIPLDKKIKALKPSAEGPPKALGRDGQLRRKQDHPNNRKTDPASEGHSCNAVYCTISAPRTKIMKTTPSNNDNTRIKDLTKTKKHQNFQTPIKHLCFYIENICFSTFHCYIYRWKGTLIIHPHSGTRSSRS